MVKEQTFELTDFFLSLSLLVVSCNIENKCHVNAQCIYNERIDRHVCLCRTGYKGDGITCRHERKFCFWKKHPRMINLDM